MAKPTDSITVRFPLLERTFDNETGGILSYTIESDYTTPADGWSVKLWSSDFDQLIGLELQPVEILVNGVSQVIGRVDITEIGGDQGTALSVSGRDYLSDLVECHVDPTLKVNKGMTISDALLLAFGPAGITDIVDDADIGMRNIRTGASIDAAAPPAFKELKIDDLKPEPGQTMFDWANRLASRHGCTIQPGRKRTEVVLSRPNYEQDPTFNATRRTSNPAANRNNVLSTRARRDLSSFPTYMLTTGKQKAKGDKEVKHLGLAERIQGWTGQGGSGGGATGAELSRPRKAVQFVGQDAMEDIIFQGRVKPTDAAKAPAEMLYRLHYQRDDQARDADELEKIHDRAVSEFMKDTLTYTVRIQGHADRDSGAVYAVDTVINVDDEVTGVFEPLWIASRSFEYSQGPTTTLRCWRLNAFQI